MIVPLYDCTTSYTVERQATVYDYAQFSNTVFLFRSSVRLIRTLTSTSDQNLFLEGTPSQDVHLPLQPNLSHAPLPIVFSFSLL